MIKHEIDRKSRISCFILISTYLYERRYVFVMKIILIKGIQFYRKYLSPMKSTKCPYFPTCSQYGLEAIEKYGAFKGGLLAIWRILRCNPFSKGGYDPVP